MKYFIYSAKIFTFFIFSFENLIASYMITQFNEKKYTVCSAEMINDIIAINATSSFPIHPIADENLDVDRWNEQIQNEKGVFNIERNSLTHIPNDYLLFTNISELNISRNKLEDLPPEFGNLFNLEILKATHNQFTEIPEILYDMKGIRTLDLQDNHIMVLRSRIAELPNLNSLNLLGNTALPQSQIQRFSYSPKLNNLDSWVKEKKLLITFPNGDEFSRSILKNRLRDRVKKRQRERNQN